MNIKRIEMVGKRFGKLTVIKHHHMYIAPSRLKNGKAGESVWECLCDCGNTAFSTGTHLRKGKSTKCRECACKGYRLNGKLSSAQYSTIKRNASVRDITFSENMTRQHLYELYLNQNGKCFFSGIDINFAETMDGHKHGESTASLDRIDSAKGYEDGNVCWVHKNINRMKCVFSSNEFIELCKKVAAYSGTL